MHGKLRCGVLGLLAMAFCGSAGAAEIVLEHSAVDKLVAQTVFSNNGRYDLVKGACSAYLDRPSVAIEGGRIRIRSHLTARVGVVDGRSCLGVSIAKMRAVELSLDGQSETLRYLVRETKVWTELTTLLIPGLNDSDRELGPEVTGNVHDRAGDGAVASASRSVTDS